jgi:hypothetical protein
VTAALTAHDIFWILWLCWMLFMGYCTGMQISHWQRRRRAMRRQPPEAQALFKMKRKFERRMELWMFLHPRASLEDARAKAHEMAQKTLKDVQAEIYIIRGECPVEECDDGWVLQVNSNTDFPERVPCDICKKQHSSIEAWMRTTKE